MKAKAHQPELIDAYLAGFEGLVRERMQTMREIVLSNAPGATETMAYGIPSFVLNGVYLVHFAGYRSHVGFYPGPSGIEAFKTVLANYKSAKGSVQFPLDQPLPTELIGEIVRFRVKENNAI